MLAPQASLQKMMARIDADLAGGAPLDEDVAPGEAPARTSGGRRTYRWLAIAAAVQTFAIALLLALVWRQATDAMSAPRFATLSDAASSVTEGATLRIVFEPETPAGRMQSLLRSVDAQIVAGPTEAGVYTVQLGEGADAEQIARALTSVRADGHVIFAEHVSMERSP